MPAPTLSRVGFDIRRQFGEVDALDRQAGDAKHREWPRTQFAAESDRFELWAINMGLFVPGHGSLDYRIRDSATLKKTFASFMTDLVDSLDQVLQYCSGAFDDESPHDADNPDDSDGDWTLDVSPTAQTPAEADSDIDLLLDSVRDPIDRLYKLSTRIRSPSTRFASSKAQVYQKIDPESKRDFLKEAEPFDRDYVSSLFLQYHKDNATRDASINEPPPSPANLDPGSSPDDVVWEPIRSVLSVYRSGVSDGTESFLVDRLARANIRRRRQFAYWTHHREKLQLHTQSVAQHARVTTTSAMVALENLGLGSAGGLDSVLMPVASVTTATCLQIQMTQLAIWDDRSAVSQSEYAPSSHPGVEDVDFPPPPKRKQGEKNFECPYCFTLCPATSLSTKAWRAHLIRDLRPYVCTYEACRNPDQLYDTREDWIQHETTNHFAAWRCLEHEGLSFSSVEEYQAHLAACHGAGRRVGESSLVPPDRRCPICNFSAASELHKHIALHLERVALFSLPHVDGDDEDDGSEASSQSVNLPDNGSRDDECTNPFKWDLYDDDGSDITSQSGSLPDDLELIATLGLAYNIWMFIKVGCRIIHDMERVDHQPDLFAFLDIADMLAPLYDQIRHHATTTTTATAATSVGTSASAPSKPAPRHKQLLDMAEMCVRVARDLGGEPSLLKRTDMTARIRLCLTRLERELREAESLLHTGLLTCIYERPRIDANLRSFLDEYCKKEAAITAPVFAQALPTGERIAAETRESVEAGEAHTTQKTTELKASLMEYISSVLRSPIEQKAEAWQDAQRERLLRSLMVDYRSSQVRPPHGGTLEWIFNHGSHGYQHTMVAKHPTANFDSSSNPLSDVVGQPTDSETDGTESGKGVESASWNSFSDWLRSTEPRYWIVGNPGSGKTTLMKYLAQHEQTQSLLGIWSPGAIVVSHFFWWNGTQMERSIKGLLCSLLYQLLTKSEISLICILRKDPTIPVTEAAMDWSQQDLQSMLLDVMANYPRSIAVFVDGLDEVLEADGLLKLMEVIDTLGKPLGLEGKVKLCLSARPYPLIVDRLSNCPHIPHLDVLNKADFRL
ncbi:hypothetical protein RB597_010336 [Gaeumannomyces tritici]